ncbi:hypothetical protein [Methylobacterium haplocladii]|nr:hypothetical protein [Methylobacterium haplocladii]GJD83629.1 hypothetical protein HPGCJGGD_1499 [Methylobacterium haplocladii]
MAGATDDDARSPRLSSPDRLVAAEGGANAPVLFFDVAPVFGMRGGVFSLVLETFVQDISEADAGDSRRLVVAHLRTTAEGIRSLKEAIEKIELMAAPSQGGTN